MAVNQSVAASLRGLALLIVTGGGLGFLATAYGAVRSGWRLNRWIGGICDWLWWMVAALIVFVVLVWVDWGVLSLWYLAAVAVGYGLWVHWAAPAVYPLCERTARCQARAVRALMWPLRRGGALMVAGARRAWLARPGRPKV